MAHQQQQQTITFCYDVVCPYAYIASRRIESVAAQANARLIFRPVLLGGLYRLDSAPQGTDSATSVMPKQKQWLVKKDLFRQLNRFKVPHSFHPQHPVKSVYVQRLLCAVSDEQRPALTHALYRAYWVDNVNISSIDVLTDILNKMNLPTSLLQSTTASSTLHSNTQWAHTKGAFGVPFFVLNDGHPSLESTLFGQDRLAFVLWKLGANTQRQLPRFYTTPCSPPLTCTFYFDLSSPWAFLGYLQLHQLHALGNVKLVPILVGALFQTIGTPTVPLHSFTALKRAYFAKDLNDWYSFYNCHMEFPSFFPIQSVRALRVVIVEPKTVDVLFRAIWQKQQNISEEKVLLQVLNEAGFDGAKLIEASNSAQVKDQLRSNTSSAASAGVIGVPSYQVGAHLIWGQDRLDVVQDLMCGWQPPVITLPEEKQTPNSASKL